MNVDDQITAPSRQLYPDGFVYDPAIAAKERYRLAKILRCRGDVEHQPQLSGICLRGKVETERRIAQRLSSKFKQPGLRSGGDAIFLVVEIRLGQGSTRQAGRGDNGWPSNPASRS